LDDVVPFLVDFVPHVGQVLELRLDVVLPQVGQFPVFWVDEEDDGFIVPFRCAALLYDA